MRPLVSKKVVGLLTDRSNTITTGTLQMCDASLDSAPRAINGHHRLVGMHDIEGISRQEAARFISGIQIFSSQHEMLCSKLAVVNNLSKLTGLVLDIVEGEAF